MKKIIDYSEQLATLAIQNISHEDRGCTATEIAVFFSKNIDEEQYTTIVSLLYPELSHYALFARPEWQKASYAVKKRIALILLENYILQEVGYEYNDIILFLKELSEKIPGFFLNDDEKQSLFFLLIKKTITREYKRYIMSSMFGLIEKIEAEQDIILQGKESLCLTFLDYYIEQWSLDDDFIDFFNVSNAKDTLFSIKYVCLFLDYAIKKGYVFIPTHIKPLLLKVFAKEYELYDDQNEANNYIIDMRQCMREKYMVEFTDEETASIIDRDNRQ